MEIQIFKNEQFGEIRTMVGENGEPWFVGKDVADVLGYSKPLDALQRHIEEDDSVKHGLIDSRGRNQQTIFINESGLYSLILSSKLPQAKEFKRWVTSVVLPQIRKTGGYIPTNDDDDEKTILSKALRILNRTLEQKNAIIEAQKPMVEFAQDVMGSENSIYIRELAKLITKAGVKIGSTRLFRWLRKHHYLFQRNTLPIQDWVECGILELEIRPIRTQRGTKNLVLTKVTSKGVKYFIEGFKSGRFSPLTPEGGSHPGC